MEKNKIVRLVVSIFLFGLLSVGYSQVQKIKVLDVRIEGSERQDIIRTSGLTKGDLISMDDVQNAIKRLWSRQLFSDVQVEIEKQVGDGVFLLIRVKEYPRLITEKFLEFHGNKKIKDKKFEEDLALEAGQVVSDWAVSRAKRKMLEMYHEKGYLLAKVVPETFSSTQGSERVILRFDITEGNKVQIKKILFKGNTGFSDGKLRKQMEETKEDTWYRGADFDEENYEADKILVLDFYRNNGYRDAEIINDSLYYMNDLKDMYLEIALNEGRQYKFGKITFEGNSAFSEDELRQNLSFVEGDVYSQEELTKTQQERLGNLYYDNGYIFSNVPWKETPIGDDVVDIHWFISEGKPAKVGRIEVAGNTRTMDKVIRRELRIYPGEIFSKDKVARSQREVHMLNYGSDVQIQPVPAEEDLINLKFTVKEKSTDTAHMSAGYSERDKLIGNIGVAMNNLFGTGQRLSFDWNFGKYYRSFQISYTEPWMFDTPTLGGISFYDTKRELSYYQPFEENSRGASVRMGRRFHWPDNYFRGDWIYGLARYNYSNFEDWYLESYPYGIASMQWPLTISSFTQIISRNSFDMPEFPTRGSEFSYSFELAGTVLGGDSNFQKHMLSM
ncbi:outer membrane protein assembly factor BamA [bacterium]|nr:outer membrane protein assembly factor BamA [bacterium]